MSSLPPTSVRIKGTVMGGGFGGKEDIAGQIHSALAATITGASAFGMM